MDVTKFKAGDIVRLTGDLRTQFPGMTTGRIVKFDQVGGRLCPFIAWLNTDGTETKPIPFMPAEGLEKIKKKKGK